MAGDGFLFIEETGAPHNRVTRAKIKMHVMDRVVKEKSTSKSGRPRVRRLESNDGQELHQRIQSADADRKLITINDMVRLAGLPIELGTTETKFILHHFLNTYSPTMCTVASETGWLKYALEDGALFNSTLYYWALLNHKRLPVRFLNEESVIRLKVHAISKITPRLNATNHNGVDDAVIASVACLANVNLKLGNLDEAKIHFRGLVAMIRGRRGIHTLGYEGLIARLLKATDSFHAQLNNTTLSFAESPENHGATNAILPANFYFDEILTNLRDIAEKMIASPKDTMPLRERVAIGARLLASDSEILKYIRNKTPCISTILATGSLLYSHAFLRGMETSYPLVRAVVNQLKMSIIAVYAGQADVFEANPMSLLWVLFIGALNAEEGSSDRIWFRSCLERACGAESDRITECFQELVAQNHGMPQPFYWLLQENWIQLSSVNTRIL